jgi:hypothetical protein
MSDQYDFTIALTRMRDSRSKRGSTITKKFISTIHRKNIALPSSIFNDALLLSQPLRAADDDYSNYLLQVHGPALVGRVAKQVTSNGNCLFNSASVAIIGKSKHNIMLKFFR